MGDITLNNIIGLPPIANEVDTTSGSQQFIHEDLVKDSMQILEVWPAMPEWAISLQGYRLKKAWEDYAADLKKLGDFVYPARQGKIQFACLAQNPPTEQFNNTFGESVLTKFTDVASQGIGELNFRTGGTGIQDITKWAKEQGGMLQGLVEGAEKKVGQMKGVIDKVAGEGASDVLSNLATGSKIDLAHVWKSTDFSPNYSCNIRLYCLTPGDSNAMDVRIVGPLASLLLFVVPKSKDGQTYTWPYMCYFKMTGVINSYAGYIRSISVVKGGDDNVFGYNQRPSIVDVKLDLGILYSVMLNTDQVDEKAHDLPTLTNYIKELRTGKNITPSSYTAWGGLKKIHDSSFEVGTQPAGGFFTKDGKNITESNRDNTDGRINDSIKTQKDILKNNNRDIANRGQGLLEDAKSNMSSATALLEEARNSINDPASFKVFADEALAQSLLANEKITKAKSLATNLEEAAELDQQAKQLASEAADAAELAQQYADEAGININHSLASSDPTSRENYIDTARQNLNDSASYCDHSANKLKELEKVI